MTAAVLHRSRNFVLLTGIGTVANALRWLEVLAASLFTLDATGSGLAVAVVAAARSLPLIAMGGFAGAVSDAVDRKRILVGGMWLSAASSAVVAGLAGLGWLLPWHLFAASLASGLVYGTEMPARRRMVGESVPPHLVTRAVAIDSLGVTATRVIGPLLGGAAYEFLGITLAFALCAALNLLAGLAALAVRHDQATRRITWRSLWADLREGAGFARRTPALATLLGVTVAMNMLGFAYGSLVTPLGKFVFGVSPGLTGVLAAAEPAGGTLGGIALALVPLRRNPVWLLTGGAAGFMVLLALVPLAPGFWSACAILFAAGLGTALFVNFQTVVALGETPPALRSRVMGLVTVCIGTWPVGLIVAGALGDALGPEGALTVMGLAGLTLLLPFAAAYWRRA